ncbi:MAG: hypothetical protein JRI68_31640 [Deltaproteobacteria bacterium]|nr:hypothetical protein [Deltaproteobacteria bacterium]
MMRRAIPIVALVSTLWASTAAASPKAIDLWAVDGAGKAHPLGETRASLERTVPARPPADPSQRHGDPDALRYVLGGPRDGLPSLVDIASLDGSGQPIGWLQGVAVQSVPCPPTASPQATCAATPPIRAVADEIDARHPLVRGRSVLAALGGALSLRRHGGPALGTIRVAGPRKTPIGPIERYRAKLRFVMVRLAPGGALPVGGDPRKARSVARAALGRCNALWGSCGISFGAPADLHLELVDPPPPHLLAVGCGHGLPASGGTIQLRAQGKPITTVIDPGMKPAEAARRVATSLEQAGFDVQVSDNPRMAAGAFGSTDLSVRRPGGALARLEPLADRAVSTDPTLTACIGQVSLEDGLHHFGDVDAMVGTLEERTLIKALDDHDPTTIEVVMVPGFAKGGRIGESFIGADGGTIRNVVIIDRAGIRSNRASFTLAHEIGHVLLDDPGHPDDFGIDTPTQLMDADASDPTAFGPRRLTIDECVRTLRQSGPDRPVPLLKAWPLGPLPKR